MENQELIKEKEGINKNPYSQFSAETPNQISIIGLGYVGAVSCACFSDMGHQVIGVDLDNVKVQAINAGTSPIVEEGLDHALQRGHNQVRLTATTDTHSAILNSQVSLVSVCTPSNPDGSCNLDFLKKATETIGKAIGEKESFHVVIFRSTIPPSTTRKTLIPILEKHSNKQCGKDFGVCFNPEFLRESTAIEDFYHPAKTLIGYSDKKSSEIVRAIYGNIEGEFLFSSLETAEFVKYIDNTWHALKVSFGNELGRLCKAMSVDSHEVMQIFCKDTKLNISSHYLMPGFAFGGSCLPKDTRGIAHLAKTRQVQVPIIDHINESNEKHISHAFDLIKQTNKKQISLIGLTFKCGTDDLRESPALLLLQKLHETGYDVKCYDPYISQTHIEQLPAPFNTIVKATFSNNWQAIIKETDLLVALHNDDYIENIISNISNNIDILDMVRLTFPLNSTHYNGICW